MKRVTLIATALVLAVLTVVAGNVAAQQTNASERTFLTFSSAVELPGLTLQPGTYVFKLADTASRNVVQVWNQEEDKMLGHWLFVQAERPDVTNENVIMFRETSAGATPAVQYWYFPGEKVGKEFVYPKDQAQRIAARTGTTVLSGEGEIGSVESIDAKGNVTPWQREGQSGAQASASAEAKAETESTLNNAPAAAQPTAPAGSLAGNRGVQPESRSAEIDADARISGDVAAEQRQSAQSSTQGSVGTSGVQSEGQIARADELPRTASPLALSGLIGLLSLAGALGVRALRQ